MSGGGGVVVLCFLHLQLGPSPSPPVAAGRYAVTVEVGFPEAHHPGL